MMNLRVWVSVLLLAMITGCANLEAIDDADQFVNNLPSSAAGGPGFGQPGISGKQLATDAADSCSGARRMARIRCNW